MTTPSVTRSLLVDAGCSPEEVEAVLRHDLGWGYRQIARALGVSPTTVRDRIDTAARRVANHEEDQ